jgi:hypothetical protein
VSTDNQPIDTPTKHFLDPISSLNDLRATTGLKIHHAYPLRHRGFNHFIDAAKRPVRVTV